MAGWVLFFIAGVFCVNGLYVDTNANGFTVFFADLPLIAHTFMQPVIAVGSSRRNFTEYSGNFVIEDEVLDKIELPAFLADVTGLPGRFSVILSNRDHPDVAVNLTIRDTTSEVFSSSVRVEMEVKGRDRLWFRMTSDPTEKIYGGGEQFTYLNLKGREYPMWTREQGVGRNRSDALAGIVEIAIPGAGGDYHTTYYPIPMFVSLKKYAVQGYQRSYSVLNFTDPLINEFYVHGQHLEIDLFAATTFLELVTGINKVASRIPPTLPEWIYNGAIISAEGGTEQMLNKIQQCQEAGVNISALWIQDWAGKIQTSFGYRVFWNWKWNQDLYPGLDEIIRDLSSKGIQVTAYMNPHLNVEGDVFVEAERLGYLLKDELGQTLKQDFGEFLAGTIDFLNPAAQRWYTDLIKSNIIALGFKGFMADFGEYTPVNAVSSNTSGFDPYEFHNELPVRWASTVRTALEESGTLNEILPWARSGFTGAQQFHSMVWGGDQNVDWSLSDGLPSSIVGSLSLGLSGFGLSHSDIGGFTTIDVLVMRSRELLLRWAEYCVFTPVMRTHEGNKPNLNHQIYSTPETLRDFARLTKIYSTLAPYHKEVVQQVSLEGLPAMRPLFLHYPDDAEAYDVLYEYLYGYDLLVAPVLKPREENWTVYLPSDQWIHLWDDQQNVINGPVTVTVSAPMGETPVFYRRSSKWIDLFNIIRNM